MIRRFFFTTITFFALTQLSRAQDSTRYALAPHEVQPERPTVATHAGTVAAGWLEIEAGIERDKLDTLLSYPTPILFKFGISDHIQMGFFIPHITWHDGPNIGDFGLNLKWRIVDGAPVFGDVALLPSVKFPIVNSSNVGESTIDASLVAVSSHDFGGVTMDINLGYTISTGDGSHEPISSSFWTVSSGGSVFDKLGWVFECFGYPGTKGVAGQAPTVALLFGPTLTYRPWLAFDAGCIVKVVGSQPFGLYAGLTWNVGEMRF